MKARLPKVLIAALLAPALLASGAAQGLLLMRCGPAVRMTCCCPKAKAAEDSPVVRAAASKCCSTVAVPTALDQNTSPDRAVNAAPAPTLVAAVGEAPSTFAVIARERRVPRLDPPPGPSPVLANCALLI